MRGGFPGKLAAIAGRQAGALSRAQVLGEGLSDDYIGARLTANDWQRPYPGVYVTHSGEFSRDTVLWSALLYAGRGACLCHESAADYWEISADISKTCASKTGGTSKTVHVMIPPDRRVVEQDGLKLHHANRIEDERHPARSVPVTRVEDTVLDLIDKARSLDEVMGWLIRSCQRGKTNPARLLESLAARKKIRWRRAIRDVLADVDEGVDSPLELLYLRRVERAHGFPAGSRRRHRLTEGKSQWIDVLYEDFRLVVELDGKLGHVEDDKFRDHRRDNASTVEGRVTLRYGWTDTFSNSCEVALEVAALLTRNGWSGSPRPCGPSCTVAGQAAS